MKSLLDAVKQTTGQAQGATSAPPADAGGAPPAPAPAEGGGAFEMLSQIEQTIESKVDPKLRKAYLAIVVAGRQLMFSEQTHEAMVQYMGTIKNPADVPMKVAHGIAKVISIVAKEVTNKGKQFPREAAGAASITLMTHALKYVDGQLGIPVTPQIIDETTKLTAKGILALFGVDENMMRQTIQHAAQQKPQAAPAGKAASDPTDVGDEDEEPVAGTAEPKEAAEPTEEEADDDEEA